MRFSEIRKILEELVTSFRFSSKIRNQKKFRNPALRELIEDFHQKKRLNVTNSLKQDSINAENLKNSYEYKVFEFSKRLQFYSTKTKSSDFLKFCDFSFYKNKNMWTKSSFYYRHYQIPSDFLFKKKLLLFILAIIGFKLGYTNGFKDSTLYDTIEERILDIKTEEQLFNILINENKPVLVLYYIPGDFKVLDMLTAMGNFIEDNESINNSLALAKVNCKYNLDLCLKKSQNMIFPQWELMYPPVVNYIKLFIVG